jgi:hypothetical protein
MKWPSLFHSAKFATYVIGLAGILDDDPDYVGSSNLGSSALSGQADHEVPSSNHGSRFSQFFQRPKPQQPELKLDERRSSIQVIIFSLFNKRVSFFDAWLS